MDGHAPLPDPPRPDSDDAVGVHEAKTQLSKLIARVEAGEEVVIKRNGKPVARLVAASSPVPRTPKIGFLKTMTRVPDSFFDPLPDEFLGLTPEE